MATSLDSVIDMALIIIRDYKLDALYESDAESFQTVLEGYMLKGLPKFEVSCMKTLNYNTDTKEFDESEVYQRNKIIEESYKRKIYGQCDGSHILIDDNDNEIIFKV